MCNYWIMILGFQLQIPIFVHFIWAGDFNLYVQALYKFFKWYFTLDKCNYPRWASVYWFDLINLKCTCPDIFSEFMKGHFHSWKLTHLFHKWGLIKFTFRTTMSLKGFAEQQIFWIELMKQLSIDENYILFT